MGIVKQMMIEEMEGFTDAAKKAASDVMSGIEKVLDDDALENNEQQAFLQLVHEALVKRSHQLNEEIEEREHDDELERLLSKDD